MLVDSALALRLQTNLGFEAFMAFRCSHVSTWLRSLFSLHQSSLALWMLFREKCAQKSRMGSASLPLGPAKLKTVAGRNYTSSLQPVDVHLKAKERSAFAGLGWPSFCTRRPNWATLTLVCFIWAFLLKRCFFWPSISLTQILLLRTSLPIVSTTRQVGQDATRPCNTENVS